MSTYSDHVHMYCKLIITVLIGIYYVYSSGSSSYCSALALITSVLLTPVKLILDVFFYTMISIHVHVLAIQDQNTLIEQIMYPNI